mmetsp:Transcript_6937/g.10924  ORF Transcript_6937/g.10924 Transcript_6937/m.10924 type:complete len:657 (-) Transcript_6937:265-2235(-)
MRPSWLLVLCFVVGMSHAAFITIKDNYFWDPAAEKYWIPLGMAFQNWNAPLGEWQTEAQIRYDLREMKKNYCDSLRVDFVWKHIEVLDDVYEWDNYDMLIKIAKEEGFRIFPIIGYQWPPDWFLGTPFQEGNDVDPGWYTMHPPSPEAAPPGVKPKFSYAEKWVSDVMSLEHPIARRKFQDFLGVVADRYKDEEAIVGWIVGNEMGYLGLWSFRQDGFDNSSIAAFKKWLGHTYTPLGGIDELNKVWKTDYPSFEDAMMPLHYSRNSPAWADLVQWREDSVADFVAEATRVVKIADPNHSVSYGALGQVFGETDWLYEALDLRKISNACRRLGYPLDYIALNSYPKPTGIFDDKSGKWGYSNSVVRSDIPILLSEIGITSTDPDISPQLTDDQVAVILIAWMEESLLYGNIMGMHVFQWSDRVWIKLRERGYGMTGPLRYPKPILEAMRDFYAMVRRNNLDQLIPTSKPQQAEIAMYWSDATDQIMNLYQAESVKMWGALERMGYEINFIGDDDFDNDAFKDYKILVLPQNQRMRKGDLKALRERVLAAGVNIFSQADLPGYEDYHMNKQDDFVNEMFQTFGVMPNVVNRYESHAREYEYSTDLASISLTGITPNQKNVMMSTWKVHDLTATCGGEVISVLTFPNLKWPVNLKNGG